MTIGGSPTIRPATTRAGIPPSEDDAQEFVAQAGNSTEVVAFVFD
jgi:hypothetical protein